MKTHKILLLIIAAIACLYEAYMLFSYGLFDSVLSRYELNLTFIVVLVMSLTIAEVIKQAKHPDRNEVEAEREKCVQSNKGIVCPNCGELNQVFRAECQFCGFPFDRMPE